MNKKDLGLFSILEEVKIMYNILRSELLVIFYNLVDI